MFGDPHIDAAIERFTGFADAYNRGRPQPPSVFADILLQYARMSRAARIVDLGSGTGLATRLWADRADEVIGIEPSDDMRRQAEQHSPAHQHIRYLKGHSTATGLPDGGADVVTASQSLHFMEPSPTFAEVARILRPGGVFAAIDNDWPLIMDWEAEHLHDAFIQKVEALLHETGAAGNVRGWSKHEHLERMRASGQFGYTREFGLHTVETGNAARFMSVMLSQGSLQTLLKNGMTPEALGLDTLQAEAQRILGDAPRPFYVSYRVRLGVKQP